MIDQLYIDQISGIATKAVVDEWIKQGHSLTKKFERTIERKVVESTGKTILEFYVQDYAVIQNQGVAASRIPYTKGSGRRTSKYIDGLIKYALQFFRALKNTTKRLGGFGLMIEIRDNLINYTLDANAHNRRIISLGC